MSLRESSQVKHVNTITNAYQISALRIKRAITGVRAFLYNLFVPKTLTAPLASIAEVSKCSASRLKPYKKLALEMKSAPTPWHALAASASYMGLLRTMKCQITTWHVKVGSSIREPHNHQFVSPLLK
jgi:hypothetical protein